MHVPGQPEVEVQMNEYAGNTHNTMCAVALLENINGEIKVSREVQFFPSHTQMNDTYRWGLKFRSGRK
jgi:tellurite resistance protein TerA